MSSRNNTTNYKALTIWTIVLNLFIIVAAGHGGGFLGLIEIFWLPKLYWIGTEDFSLSLASSYDKTLGFAAMASLLGQLILIITFLVKQNLRIIIKIIGLLFLWIGFFYLIHNLLFDQASQIGFVTGLPFLTVSVLLLFKTLNQRQEVVKFP